MPVKSPEPTPERAPGPAGDAGAAGATAPRRYRSQRRAEQAAATRTAVLRAARELFATAGYAATTVAQVARKAGVSLDTVYASVGRKPELLLAVHDMALSGGDVPQPALERDYVTEMRSAASASDKLVIYAQALAARLPQVAPLAEALERAAEDDDACREVWERLQRRRASNMLDLARDLLATGDLRPDLPVDAVAHRLWIANSAAFYRLATSGGRTSDDYAVLVLDTWQHTLLAAPPRPRA